MIATIVFFAEVPMFEGMLVSDVWLAVMCERAQQILVRTQAGFKDMKFVGCEWRRAQEGAEEVSRFGGIQGGCWGFRVTSWFAFILESGLCL